MRFPLLLLAFETAAVNMEDFDTIRQRHGRWRCVQADFEQPVDDALATNFTGLGWSAELVGPLLGNLTSCSTLVLDELPERWLTPLVVGLTAHCTASPAAELVEPTEPLRVLELDGSRLGDENVATLSPVLGTCTTLEAVHALDNALGDAGAASLAAALRGHPSLRLLDLGGNSIGDDGMASLAQLLLPVGSDPPGPLVDLRVHDNRIGAGGAMAFASVLRRAPAVSALRTLMLDGNPVGDAGVAALADTLRERAADTSRESVPLRRLGLSATNVTDAGVEALLAALQVAQTPLDACMLEGNPAVSVSAHRRVAAWLAARQPSVAAPPRRRRGSTAVDDHVLRVVPPTGMWLTPSQPPGTEGR